MSKELIEFRIALNKLVDDENMPEVLDLINSQALQLLDRLENKVQSIATRKATVAYATSIPTDKVLYTIQEERKQYESKEGLDE